MRLSKSGKNRKVGHRRPGTPKTGGRRPGSLNKRTIAVKEAIKFVAEQMGGAKALLAWAKSGPYRTLNGLTCLEKRFDDCDELRLNNLQVGSGALVSQIRPSIC